MEEKPEEKPELKYRLPKHNMVVMIKVKNITNNGALVSLLEFSNIEGRIEDSSYRDTEVDRIEPAFVVEVIDRIESPLSIILSRHGITDFDRRACELRYLNGKYFQSLMRYVNMSYERHHLEDQDNYFWFPPLKLLKDRKFFNTLPECLRKNLWYVACKVPYFSWRLGGHERAGQEDRFMILPSSLKQQKGVCWAIAMVRHFEALLRMNGKLLTKHLSIQDLINKTPRLDDDGTLHDLDTAGQMLTMYGIMLESDCPLTFDVPNQYERSKYRAMVTEKTTFKAKSVKVIDKERTLTTKFIKKLLEESPVTASVTWFPSYTRNNLQGIDIYEPTEKEWSAYLAKPYSKEWSAHTMLLTGHGTDEHGTLYWEFQDNYGDIDGDRGFVRYVQRPGIIIEVVEIKV